ncbi:T9SS type B sorting domain-containing protein [uncultured Gelidibacter sp.]|uniref:T9SS type B sorting domain-containing protein n=1 Tax=uncultured Gelidibacter sp. TaxID=259318 RepID=UPI002612081E|nr:T9SS type B sorting domain-containing protein [uncultured Gelidibacter sp.]
MKQFLKIFFVFSFLITAYTAQAQYPTDCVDAVIICGNSNVNLNVSGIGVQELNNSNTCSSYETNSIWLQVSLVTDGTLGFTLKPNNSSISEDYDFFVFGPNVACNELGQAIRCSTTNPSSAGLPNNYTGMRENSVDTSEGPGPDGDSFVKWLTVSAGDTYFIVIDRPIGNSGFTLEWTGTAEFSSPPSNQSHGLAPLDLEKCDTDSPYGDGFTAFNLEMNTPKIKGSQKDVTVTYHLNDTDANSNANPLTSPYTNISNPQKIVARITNTITGCFELADFTITASLGPDFKAPSPFHECDTDADGNSNNGRTYFDLTKKNPEILNGQDPSTIKITYHKSMASAQNSSDPGVDAHSYYNANPYNEQLYVRLEDPFNKNCRNITTLDLVVNPLPQAFNATIMQCDDDGKSDGITLFNLNEAKDALTGGASDRSLTYYTSKTEAQAGGPSTINGKAYKNSKNPELLYVRITDDFTGCFSVSTLNLEVSVTAANDTQLNHCDDDGLEDGFYTFTLSDADSDVLKGLPSGLDLVYYETYKDALLETHPLPNQFTNRNAYAQTIFARVENSNACYGISEVALNVYKMPTVETEAEEIYCLNTFPETLTLYSNIIDHISATYTYSWSTGETSSEIEVNSPGTYTVRITNSNGCYKDRTIKVLPSNIATISDIKINDASQNNTVAVMVTGEGSYEYALNNIKGPYQESHIFENVAPGFYTVFVRDMNGCGTSKEKISVIGFPKYFTPNNDGINDTWQVNGINGQFQSKTTIYIFNRMGKLLKQLNPLGIGWDGTYIGHPLPPDDYWFSVTLQDGRTLKGHFTLKR